MAAVPACGGAGTEPTRLVVTAAVDLGAAATAVAAGEAAVWATDGKRTLYRVDPKANRVSATIDVVAGAHQVATGEGAVWVTGPTTLSRVDPSRNQVTGTRELGAPQGVAAGRGAVWVANRSENGTLTRVDPKSLEVRAAVKVPPLPDDTLVLPQEPGQVAVGEGGVWVTDTRVGTASRLDPGTNRFTLTVSRVGPQSRGLALGQGGVWVVGRGQITRADPGRRLPDTFEIGRDPSPSSVAVGAGSVWITDEAHDSVTRVDPGTNRPSRAIELQDSPVGVAVGFGSVWVVGRAGLLSRIDER